MKNEKEIYTVKEAFEEISKHIKKLVEEQKKLEVKEDSKTDKSKE